MMPHICYDADIISELHLFPYFKNKTLYSFKAFSSLSFLWLTALGGALYYRRFSFAGLA